MKKYVHLTNNLSQECSSTFHPVLVTLTFFCLNSMLLSGCEAPFDFFQSSPQSQSLTAQKTMCIVPDLEHYAWWEGEWLMAPSVFERQIMSSRKM